MLEEQSYSQTYAEMSHSRGRPESERRSPGVFHFFPSINLFVGH